MRAQDTASLGQGASAREGGEAVLGRSPTPPSPPTQATATVVYTASLDSTSKLHFQELRSRGEDTGR